MKHQVQKWLRRTQDHLKLFLIVPLGYGILGPFVGWVLSVVMTLGFSLFALLLAIPLAYKVGFRPAMLTGLVHVLLLLLAVPKFGRRPLVISAGALLTAADWLVFRPETNEAIRTDLWVPVLFGGFAAAICCSCTERVLAHSARQRLYGSSGAD